MDSKNDKLRPCEILADSDIMKLYKKEFPEFLTPLSIRLLDNAQKSINKNFSYLMFRETEKA